jgi:hypothetical protein
MSKDGTRLIISAPAYDNAEQADAGAIYYYKMERRRIHKYLHPTTDDCQPRHTDQHAFWFQLDMNDAGTRMVIGAERSANYRDHAV